MTWTHFHDMHSGGGNKTEWGHIFIEAPISEAKRIFEERTGRDPENVTCDCCGEDYSISESPSLEEASSYERNCAYDNEAKAWVERPDTASVWRSTQPYIPISEYMKRPDVLVIRATCDVHEDCAEHPDLGRECKHASVLPSTSREGGT